MIKMTLAMPRPDWARDLEEDDVASSVASESDYSEVPASIAADRWLAKAAVPSVQQVIFFRTVFNEQAMKALAPGTKEVCLKLVSAHARGIARERRFSVHVDQPGVGPS